jgi:hypothetical protein
MKVIFKDVLRKECDMNTTQDLISANIRGPISGSVAVGKGITQVINQVAAAPLSEEDRANLEQALAALRQRVAHDAPAETQAPALERVGELVEAMNAPKPDLSTMEYVKKWFERHLPELAGSVTGVIMNPVVAKLVQSAGDILVVEFRRRFGV